MSELPPIVHSESASEWPDPHQGRRARRQHERLLFAALSATTRGGDLHLSPLCIAVHDVFLPHRRQWDRSLFL